MGKVYAGRKLAMERRVGREPGWLAPLRGKDLACWCKDGPCHADVLLDILGDGK